MLLAGKKMVPNSLPPNEQVMFNPKFLSKINQITQSTPQYTVQKFPNV